MSSEVRLYPLGTLADYRFVVLLSRMDGQFLLSRHRARTTWQNQGGHIEPGETPIEAARRELFEESGALDYDIAPLCDYQFPHGAAMVFTANIRRLGHLPKARLRRRACLTPCRRSLPIHTSPLNCWNTPRARTRFPNRRAALCHAERR